MTFADIVQIFINLIKYAIPIVGALALLFFLWGGIQLMINTGNVQAISDGKKRIFYGIIALFFMFAIWGLMALLTNTFLSIQGAPVI
jgi:TRAP-type C4-dicarboxylate transport system permease small subunit